MAENNDDAINALQTTLVGAVTSVFSNMSMLGTFCESAQFVKCSTRFVNSQKAQIFIKTCAIYRSYT